MFFQTLLFLPSTVAAIPSHCFHILHPPSYCWRVLPFKGKEMHERFAWEAAGHAGEHAALMVNATEQKSWP